MVDQIGGGGGLAREAILAAMRAQAGRSSQVRDAASSVGGNGGTSSAEAPQGFVDHLRDGIASVDDEIKKVDDLPRAIVSGEVQDIHEVAAQIKKAEFTFRFAMEIRNKLVDAYREVMRMNV